MRNRVSFMYIQPPSLFFSSIISGSPSSSGTRPEFGPLIKTVVHKAKCSNIYVFE